MDALMEFLTGLSVWHWLVLGIVLMAIEVAVGTFDLLWVGIGAFLTALFALLVPLPAGGWAGQLTFFGVIALAFVVSGRTVFRGLRNRAVSHPNLNDRLAGMVGQHGRSLSAFEDGAGKVRLGDTVWLAEAEGAAAIAADQAVIVTGARQGRLSVRAV